MAVIVRHTLEKMLILCGFSDLHDVERERLMRGLPRARKRRTEKAAAGRPKSRRNESNRCNIFRGADSCRGCVFSSDPKLFDGYCFCSDRWRYIREQIDQEQARRGTA